MATRKKKTDAPRYYSLTEILKKAQTIISFLVNAVTAKLMHRWHTV